MSQIVDNSDIIQTPLTEQDVEQLDAITMLFFAYRDFISDADRFLDQFEFGRAHHRAMFFVARKPGMTVAELLSILGITKQSLARVLKELIEGGYIHQRTGATDKRKRLLFTTVKGRELVLRLSQEQSARIANAMAVFPKENQNAILSFLHAMIDDEGKSIVSGLEAAEEPIK